MSKISMNKEIASMNTGSSVLSKLMDVEDINLLPELSDLYPRSEEVLKRIKKSFLSMSYDNAEPIVVFKYNGNLYCVDGNTRLIIAKQLADEGNENFFEIPVVEKDFDSLEDAISYARHRQLDRRNMSPAEIYTIANQNLDLEYGEGREVDVIAGMTGLSPSTIQRAKDIEKYGDEETKQAVLNNEMSITAGAKKASENKPKNARKPKDDALEDNSGNPAPISVHTEHPNEACNYSVHPEDATDRLIKEKNIQVESARKEGFTEGYGKGFETAMYFILSEVKKGKTASEIYHDERLSDLSADILVNFKLPEDAEDIVLQL